MGPSCRSRRPNSSSRTRALLRDVHHLKNSKNQETSASSPLKPFTDSSEFQNVENKPDMLACNSMVSACSTPKAERFLIPEIKTCPPPPKKRRKVTGIACSLRRTPVTFFAPPDIDLFFYFALRGIQVISNVGVQF